MSSTPDGVVLHCPNTDLSAALNDADELHQVSAMLREVPENPFQKGQHLTSEDTIIVLVDRSGSSGSHDPFENYTSVLEEWLLVGHKVEMPNSAPTSKRTLTMKATSSPPI